MKTKNVLWHWHQIDTPALTLAGRTKLAELGWAWFMVSKYLTPSWVPSCFPRISGWSHSIPSQRPRVGGTSPTNLTVPLWPSLVSSTLSPTLISAAFFGSSTVILQNAKMLVKFSNQNKIVVKNLFTFTKNLGFAMINLVVKTRENIPDVLPNEIGENWK